MIGSGFIRKTLKMKQYKELLKHILANGELHEDRTGVGTISTFGYQTRFDLRKGFPLLTTKKLPFRWIAEELLWFLSGSTDEKKLRAKGVDIWKEWATKEECARFGREEGDLGPIYGWTWRNFGGDYIIEKESSELHTGVDQIARALDLIENNPNSRRILVSGWDAREADNVSLPPCHTLFQFKVHNDNSLSCQLYMRSCDSFLGLPFNIASYALLTHLMAYVTGKKVRELIVTFGDLHIYRNHLPQVYELLSREPKELPQLDINFNNYEQGLNSLLQVKAINLSLRGYNPYPNIKAEVAI